jgi:microcystin degradation protein MlrC
VFVKDAEAVQKAFEVGVGNTAQFVIGGKITPHAPGPLVAEGVVQSLHTGEFYRTGRRSSICRIGKTAVIRFGGLDIIVCEEPASTGDPQIFRGFGIEPTLYDLIIVKANTSFRAPYSKFTTDFCMGDTPGVGAANLHLFHWEHLPKGMYPFDLPENYEPEEAVLWRG